MIRRPPRSTLDRSSAASDVYKRQRRHRGEGREEEGGAGHGGRGSAQADADTVGAAGPVSYTHLRAHETVLELVCRLLLEKKKTSTTHQLVPYP